MYANALTETEQTQITDLWEMGGMLAVTNNTHKRVTEIMATAQGQEWLLDALFSAKYTMKKPVDTNNGHNDFNRKVLHMCEAILLERSREDFLRQIADHLTEAFWDVYEAQFPNDAFIVMLRKQEEEETYQEAA